MYSLFFLTTFYRKNEFEMKKLLEDNIIEGKKYE